MFPWLSGIAPGFETYELLDLSFEFISRCATTVNGMIYMAIDYDAGDVNNNLSE